MTITKDSIVKKITDKTGFSTQKALSIVDKILQEIKENLQKGQNVLISGFGKFVVYSKKSRRGRNPQTNKKIELKPRRVVSFKTSPKLKRELNENPDK
jgi:integration host factor subunit alpha